MPLTVAAAQATSASGDIERNVESAVTLVRDAAGAGARLVVLPELFLCGYDLATVAARPQDCFLTDAEHDPRLEPLTTACATTGTTALVGAAVQHARGRRTISILVVTEQVQVGYDKQHLCGDEAAVFVPGGDGALLDVESWPVGLAVCYDGCFPEHARAATDAGALMYAAPVAYLSGGEHRRDLYYRARAVENGIFVVVSGLVGHCGDGEFSGGSGVFDPEGRPLAVVPDFETGLAVATIDAGALERTRSTHQMYADHRASLGTVRQIAPAPR